MIKTNSVPLKLITFLTDHHPHYRLINIIFTISNIIIIQLNLKSSSTTETVHVQTDKLNIKLVH